MDTHINLKSTASFELREALLVYSCDRTPGGSGSVSSFVTKHPVKQSATGAPSLGAGSPLGESDIVALIEQLRGSLPSEFLPENVLMRTQETIVWWTASGDAPDVLRHQQGSRTRAAFREAIPPASACPSCPCRIIGYSRTRSE